MFLAATLVEWIETLSVCGKVALELSATGNTMCHKYKLLEAKMYV